MTDPETIYRVCQYLRDYEESLLDKTFPPCKRCPLSVETSYGPGTLGCVLYAQELIAIVKGK